MYQVSNAYFISGTEIECSIQVTTGQQPFPGVHMGIIVHNVVLGGRPGRPQGPSEWLSNDVWNVISRCWSSSWNGRPNINFVMNALSDAADTVEDKRRKLHATTDDRGKRTSRRPFVASRSQQPRRTDTFPQRSPDPTSGKAERQPSPMPQNNQRTPGPVKQPSQASAFSEASTTQLEPWEMDLVAFLRGCRIGTEAKLEGKKAQEFVDKLDAVRYSGNQVHLVS